MDIIIFQQEKFIINGEEEVPVSLVDEEWKKFMINLGRSPSEVSYKDLIAYFEGRFGRHVSNMFASIPGLQLRENHKERMNVFYEKQKERDRKYRQNNREEINRRKREKYASKKAEKLRPQLQQLNNRLSPMPVLPSPKLNELPLTIPELAQPMLQPQQTPEVLSPMVPKKSLEMEQPLTRRPGPPLVIQLPPIQLPASKPVPEIPQKLEPKIQLPPQPALVEQKPSPLQRPRPKQHLLILQEEEEEEEDADEPTVPPSTPPPTDEEKRRTRHRLFDIPFPSNIGLSPERVIQFYADIIDCLKQNLRDVTEPNQYPAEYVAIMSRLPDEYNLGSLRKEEYQSLLDWLDEDARIIRGNKLPEILSKHVEHRNNTLTQFRIYFKRVFRPPS